MPLDHHIDKLQISNIILQPKSCQHLSTAGKVTGADIRFLNQKSKLGKTSFFISYGLDELVNLPVSFMEFILIGWAGGPGLESQRLSFLASGALLGAPQLVGSLLIVGC